MSIKYWLQHNRSRIVTALVFCLVFSLLAFAPPFSTSAHAIALADDAIFLILAALLASSGILLVSESSGNVTDFLQDAINDFCADVGESWDTIKSSFQFGVDKLGNVLTNNSVLSFFSRFADWMTRFYGLTDNDVSLVTPPSGFYIGDYPLYPAGTVFSESGKVDSGILSFSQPDIYFSYYSSDGRYYFYALSLTDYNNPRATAVVTWNQATKSETLYLDPAGVYFLDPSLSLTLTRSYAVAPNIFLGSQADLISYVSSHSFSSSDSPAVEASTGTITIPVDGTNFDDTDGAVIDGVGAWGDSWNDILEKLRDWLDAQSSSTVADPSLTVEAESEIAANIETDLLSTDNWPGLLPPVGFTEFSFSSIWHYVTDWLAAFSGTLATVMGISFSLPAISIFYAVVVLSLTLWLLRKVSSS